MPHCDGSHTGSITLQSEFVFTFAQKVCSGPTLVRGSVYRKARNARPLVRRVCARMLPRILVSRILVLYSCPENRILNVNCETDEMGTGKLIVYAHGHCHDHQRLHGGGTHGQAIRIKLSKPDDMVVL